MYEQRGPGARRPPAAARDEKRTGGGGVDAHVRACVWSGETARILRDVAPPPKMNGKRGCCVSSIKRTRRYAILSCVFFFLIFFLLLKNMSFVYRLFVGKKTCKLFNDSAADYTNRVRPESVLRA